MSEARTQRNGDSPKRRGVLPWFDAWIATQEFNVLLDAYTVSAWMITTVAVVFVLGLLSWFGGAVLSVPFFAGLIAWVPTLGTGLWICGLVHRPNPPVRWIWVLVLVESSLMQAFLAFLVTVGGSHSVLVFGPLLVFIAAYHGYMNRVTVRHPFGALGTAGAVSGAYAVAPTVANATHLIALGAASIAFGLLVGTYSLKRYQRRQGELQLRGAVLAQMDAERQKVFDDARETIVETSARNHDVNNLLMLTGMLADTLKDEVNACRGGEDAWKEVDSLMSQLSGNIEEVRRRVVETKQAFREKRRLLEGVGVDAAVVAEQILRQLARRFPHVRFVRTGLPANGVRPLVAVFQGESTLARILENLIINACEGRTGSAASTVECRIAIDSSGNAIAIEILDDGPGFPEAVLQRVGVSMQTTKRDGSGLGLYTVSRLARASGGTLELSQREAGGACARVVLPIAAEAGVRNDPDSGGLEAVETMR
jgi:signal transduction histidine kinase